MPPLSASNAQRTAIPNSRAKTNNVILYDGSGLSVDYAAYLAQHDLVYKAPPLQGEQAMPIGDGDVGAMLWCPDSLHLQVQKGDLWADPPTDSGPPENWQQLSAGAVAIHSDPPFLQAPHRFEQRLSLHSGVVTLSSDNSQGACQVTAFASATAGVLVINYKDQTIRNARRHVEVSLWRDAHLFALGEHIGILQALRDRRYALIARVAGAPATARMERSRRTCLHIEPSRSTDLTLYVAVAVSPRNGDPVGIARSRIEAAMAKGFDRLLVEQRQHWSMFWQKSFLRLVGSEEDPLPGYLENLWYLTLYQLACCSRGFDAPLANGGLWLNAQDSRSGPALYEGAVLRNMLAALIPSNHLELSVPYVDTYHRLLPEMAARTGSAFGVGGARFPARFNRFGQEFPPEGGEQADLPQGREQVRPAQQTPEGAPDTLGPQPAGSDAGSLPLSDPAPASSLLVPPLSLNDLTDGLDTALLIWEAWRHAPDPFFLKERAYPLLRAAATFVWEYCQTAPRLANDGMTRAKLAAALNALLWSSREYEIDEDLQEDWEAACITLSAGGTVPCSAAVQPFGDLDPTEVVPVLHSWLAVTPHLPSGLWAQQKTSPDLAPAARLGAGLNALLLTEQPLPLHGRSAAALAAGGPDDLAGAYPGVIRVFPALPEAWSAAFTLAAPGGFRISAEAAAGQARYVAVKSLLGGICRLVNPWGVGERARILEGREPLLETAAPVLEFMTQPNASYLIEKGDLPLSRAVSVRLGGKRNTAARRCGPHLLGIEADPVLDGEGRGAPAPRLPRLDRRTAVVNRLS